MIYIIVQAHVSGYAAKLLALACSSKYYEIPELLQEAAVSTTSASRGSTYMGAPNATTTTISSIGEGGAVGGQNRVSSVRMMEVINALLQTRDICNEMVEATVGLANYDRPQELLALMGVHPVISMSALRWTTFVLADTDFTQKTAFLSILPVILQIGVEAGQRYPRQQSDCFEVFKTVLILSPTGDKEEDKIQMSHLKSSADSYTIVTAQKDALQCLVYLMGSGYVIPPMAFLTSYLSELDAVHVRHLLHILITTVKPPFANIFAVKLVQLMSAESARKAIMSSHFPRSDAVALCALCKQLVECFKTWQQTAAYQKETADDHDDDSPATSSSSSSSLSVFSDTLERFSSIVQECASSHRLLH